MTKRDLRKYVTGAPLDPDVWTWINLQVKGDDNSVKLQVAEMRARMKEPFAVDWGSLAATLDEGQSELGTITDPPDRVRQYGETAHPSNRAIGTRFRRSTVALIGTTAVVLIAALTWILLRPAPREIALNDGSFRFTYHNGAVSARTTLPSESKDRVVRAFRDELNLSLALALRGEPKVQRLGSNAEESFDLLYPVGTAVRSDRPTFSWQPLPNAQSYNVKIFDSDGNVVAESPLLSENEAQWTIPLLDNPLTRGRIYSWQVTALRKGEEMFSPVPPEPPAKLKVLDEHTLDELDRLETQTPLSHLTLGAAYAEVGLIEEAVSQFQELLQTNPNNDVVRKLRARLQPLLSPKSRP